MSSIRVSCLAFVLIACPSPSPPSDEWAPAFDATDAGWLLSVWGPSPAAVYAVGGDNQPSRGTVWRREAGRWREVSLGVETPLLNWVTGFGEDDVVIVGNRGTVLRGDGTTWERQETPTDQDLWGVWGSGPDDVWAVGGVPFMGGIPTVIRWDGVAWREVELPELVRANVFAFFKVWGTGPSDVWIVGQRGVLLHWDGSAWEERFAGVDADLISLWGTRPDRVAMVGGRGNGWIVTWDGAELRRRQPPGLPGLNGVWMGSDDVIHVVGEQGEIATFDFDSLEMIDELFPTTLTFHAIFGDGERLTTVGGNFSMPAGPFRGVAYDRAQRASD
ncbi:MAG: hypothetical protein KF901_21955 [Myxococcales bacterium]|nr:hypothetical protein [Myxococcales bacterium]